MKYFYLLVLTLTSLAISAQEVSIDIVINKEPLNTEYSAEKLMKEVVDKYQNWKCTNITFVNSIEEGTSPYLLEIWESPEFINNFVFKKTKNKKVKNSAGGITNKKITEAGLKVRTNIDYYGRLSERKTTAVLQIFKINGNHDKIISDEEVKKKYQPKHMDNVDLEEAMLVKHKKRIAELRVETLKGIKLTMRSALLGCLNNSVLGPVKLVEAAESSKDKIKKMTFDRCPETPLTGDGQRGTLSCYSQEELNGVTYFLKQGEVYKDIKEHEGKDVLKVAWGHKEVFAAHETKKPLLMGFMDYLEPYELSISKEGARNVSFHLEYQEPNSYSDLDKTLFELLLQVRYVGNRNINILTKDPLLNDDGSPTDATKTEFSQPIFVTIDAMKKGPKDQKTGAMKTANITLSTIVNNEPIEVKTEVKGYQDGFNNHTIIYKDFRMTDIDNVMLTNDIEIVGIIESKKKEVKRVLIRTTRPIAEGNLKVYNTKLVEKKTKHVAKLKIKEITGRYTAIAEVTDGKKKLLPLIESTEKLKLMFVSASMLSLNKPDSAGYRFLKRYIEYTP